MSARRVVLIGGGVRSGKSAFAQARAEELGRRRLFVATAEGLDDEMRARIARHRAERADRFDTIEAPRDLPGAIAAPGYDVVLVDCLTLWLSNLLVASEDERAVADSVDALVAALERRATHVVVVTNEVGLGIVPATPLGRMFRDVAGRAHQRLAAVADEIHFAALGMLLRLRPGPVEAHSVFTARP